MNSIKAETRVRVGRTIKYGTPKARDSRRTRNPRTNRIWYSVTVMDGERQAIEDLMSTRLTTQSVTFRRPFTVNDMAGEQPPGVYIVETEEELLETVSFPAYRRLSTVMRCPTAGGIIRFVTIDPTALNAALERDARPD